MVCPPPSRTSLLSAIPPDEPGSTVTLSYRKDSFGRIKKLNQTLTDEYVAAKKMTVILESSVKAIGADEVVLKTKEGEKTIKNDNIFALLGAEPPTKFFEKCGIKIIQPATPEMEELARSRGNRRYSSKCDHCTGHDDQACISACPTGAILEIKPDQVFAPLPLGDGKRAPFRVEPFEQGIPSLLAQSMLRRIGSISAIVSLLTAIAVGLECFLRATVPAWSLAYQWQLFLGEEPNPVKIASGSGLGYVLGIIGTALMGTTALYPLQSRLNLLRALAKTRFWLSAHIVAGSSVRSSSPIIRRSRSIAGRRRLSGWRGWWSSRAPSGATSIRSCAGRAG